MVVAYFLAGALFVIGLLLDDVPEPDGPQIVLMGLIATLAAPFGPMIFLGWAIARAKRR